MLVSIEPAVAFDSTDFHITGDGGADTDSIADYIAAGAWAISGSWICNKGLINAGDMQKVTELTGQALHVIEEARKAER